MGVRLKNLNRKWKAVFSITLAALVLGLLVFASVKLAPVMLHFFHNREEARQTLLSHGWLGVFIYMGVQALQVVLAFIPGEPIQFAGGYVYGALQATVYIVLGVLAGELVGFFIGRLIGSPLVSLFMPHEKQERFSKMINGVRGKAIIFLLFLIPGLPKDALVYVAGITSLRPLTFLSLSMLARLPATVGGAFIGASLHHGHYRTAVALIGAAVVLFAVGILLREPLLQKLEHHGHRAATEEHD